VGTHKTSCNFSAKTTHNDSILEKEMKIEFIDILFWNTLLNMLSIRRLLCTQRSAKKMSSLSFYAIPQLYCIKSVNAYKFEAKAKLDGEDIPIHIVILPVDNNLTVPRIVISLEGNDSEKLDIFMQISSSSTEIIRVWVDHFCPNMLEGFQPSVLSLAGPHKTSWNFSGKIEGTDYSNGSLLQTHWVVRAYNPMFHIYIVKCREDIIPYIEPVVDTGIDNSANFE